MLSILLTHKLCSFCVYLIGHRDVWFEKMTATQKHKPQRGESLLENSSVIADHFKLTGVLVAIRRHHSVHPWSLTIIHPQRSTYIFEIGHIDYIHFPCIFKKILVPWHQQFLVPRRERTGRCYQDAGKSTTPSHPRKRHQYLCKTRQLHS